MKKYLTIIVLLIIYFSAQAYNSEQHLEVFNEDSFSKKKFHNSSSLFLKDSIPINFSYTTIPKLEEKKNYIIYPNPFSDYLNINGAGKNELYTLINAFGQKIEKQRNISNFNLSSLAIGIYFLEIRSEESSKVVKLLKQ